VGRILKYYNKGGLDWELMGFREEASGQAAHEILRRPGPPQKAAHEILRGGRGRQPMRSQAAARVRFHRWRMGRRGRVSTGMEGGLCPLHPRMCKEYNKYVRIICI